jgi:hypothetical protein
MKGEVRFGETPESINVSLAGRVHGEAPQCLLTPEVKLLGSGEGVVAFGFDQRHKTYQTPMTPACV